MKVNLSRKNIIIGVIFLGVGIAIGFSLSEGNYLKNKNGYLELDNAIREGGYNFINPLLFCDISEDKQFQEYKPVKSKLETYINQNISSGDTQDISVYLRNLDNGHWLGVNENDQYSPASLLKIPIMVAYLKKIDTNSKILNQKIAYHQITDENAEETFKPKRFIEDGKTYSIDELIKYMIMYSDNNAAIVLKNNLDDSSFKEIYSDLGIPIPQTLEQQIMTPKIYSRVFRVLYNATYLSKPMSQYALALLSATDFPQGIKAGIPASMPSSQKFGERTVATKDEATGKTAVSYRELHDCGIVYYPQNPYLLCVMTKGNDFEKMSRAISDISALIYKETVNGVLKFKL